MWCAPSNQQPQGRPGRSRRVPGLASRAALLALCALLAGGGSGRSEQRAELREFLAPVRPPDGRFTAVVESDEFEGRRAGFPCGTFQGINVCRNPRTHAVVRFSLVNRGSPRVNPHPRGVLRRFGLVLDGRARQNLKLQVTERSRPRGRASHIFMRSALYFFPRIGVPSLRLVTTARDRDVLEVRLPTGEPVCFDARTHEIVGGVLREDAPIDANPDRHARKFPRLSYLGGGVLVRVDQRGDTPEKAVVWGVRKLATIYYAQRRCKLSPTRLWEQESGWFDFRFADDPAFYKFLARKCGWISMLKRPPDPPARAVTCKAILER